MWVMHPVVTGGKLGVSGSLHTTVQLGQGVTLPPDPNNNNAATTLDKFSVALVDANNNPVGSPLPLTLDNQGVGTADFFLEAGTYTLSLVPPQWIASVTTNPATPLTVTVTAGQTTNVTLTVTGAAAASGGT